MRLTVERGRRILLAFDVPRYHALCACFQVHFDRVIGPFKHALLELNSAFRGRHVKSATVDDHPAAWIHLLLLALNAAARQEHHSDRSPVVPLERERMVFCEASSTSRAASKVIGPSGEKRREYANSRLLPAGMAPM